MVGNAFTGSKIWQKMSFNFFDAAGLETYEELKKAYFEQVKVLHPDAGGNAEDFKVMRDEYKQLEGYLFNQHATKEGKMYEGKEKEADPAFEQFVNAFVGLHIAGKIKMYVCGAWIWIETTTREYRDILKTYGARWSSTKNMWYWSPNGLGNRKHKAYYKNFGEVAAHWGISDEYNIENAGAVAIPF